MAFIFDMDGVLINSMPYHAEAWKRALAIKNIFIDENDIYEIEGLNHKDVIKIFYDCAGIKPSEKDFQELNSLKIDIYKQIENVSPFEGMKDLLKLLKRRKKLLGIVSGSDKDTVLGIVNKFFPGIFDVIVDGDDVEKGKPSPAPYLMAIYKLNISKDLCIAIENSPIGILSAKKAGIKCIGIPTYLNIEKMKDADVIVEDHNELISLLKGIDEVTSIFMK
jgi:beta-phosphoglucomutase